MFSDLNVFRVLASPESWDVKSRRCPGYVHVVTCTCDYYLDVPRLPLMK